MNLPSITIKQLLEAGVHLGHKTFRWNPQMNKYIFGSKNSIHIIDLVQTLELVNVALNEIHKCISSGGKVLFVSTKKQAAETIANLAKDTSQFYVNHRWLGGMLTNWKTISNSIKRLKKLTKDLKEENTGFTKKENLKMGIQRDKLERSLGGIADMKKLPDIIFIIDTNAEELAVKESIRLNIPIVAIVDTNSDPTGINFPIPGNDDARRAINLYCELIKQTILDAQKNISKTDRESLIEAKNNEPIKEAEKEKINTKEEKVKKETALKEHINSIKKHYKELGEKNYPDLYEINTPDFVLMFVPIEPALLTAFDKAQNLFIDALEKNIVLVSNSTLLATLSTVASVWKQEDQKKNALEIAKAGGLLYDKFEGFVQDLLDIGNKINSSQNSYKSAMEKLTKQSGNLVWQVERLKTLGAKTKKSIPQRLLDKSR